MNRMVVGWMLCSLFCTTSAQAQIDFVIVTETFDREGSIFKQSESRLFYVDANGLVICRVSGLNSAPEYRIIEYGPEHVKREFLNKIERRDMQEDSTFSSEMKYTTGFYINILFAPGEGRDEVVHVVTGDVEKPDLVSGEKVRRDVLKFYEKVSKFDCEGGERWEPELIKLSTYLITKKNEKQKLEKKDDKGNNRYMEWSNDLPKIDTSSHLKSPYGDYIYLGNSVRLQHVYRDLVLREAIRMDGALWRVGVEPIFPAELRKAQEACARQRTKDDAQCKIFGVTH